MEVFRNILSIQESESDKNEGTMGCMTKSKNNESTQEQDESAMCGLGTFNTPLKSMCDER